MPPSDSNSRRILGIEFFTGSVEEAVGRMERGGLLVVPSGPGMKSLPYDAAYREALLGADLAIMDSALMVLLWNVLERDRLERLSGLKYQKHLLENEGFRRPGNTLWVMAGEQSAARNLAYLASVGISVPGGHVYVAPRYGAAVEDAALLELAGRLRPQHIMITVGGGVQEKLGFYLRRNLAYVPAIHCTGAAIAFLSGDQVHIPIWVDRFYLGWLVRSLSDPRQYVPRYWDARKLAGLMLRYRDRLPEADPAAR